MIISSYYRLIIFDCQVSAEGTKVKKVRGVTSPLFIIAQKSGYSAEIAYLNSDDAMD
jgi:hypothetical protein